MQIYSEATDTEREPRNKRNKSTSKKTIRSVFHATTSDDDVQCICVEYYTEENFLENLAASSFDDSEVTSDEVTPQLVDIVNERWGKKLAPEI